MKADITFLCKHRKYFMIQLGNRNKSHLFSLTFFKNRLGFYSTLELSETFKTLSIYHL